MVNARLQKCDMLCACTYQVRDRAPIVRPWKPLVNDTSLFFLPLLLTVFPLFMGGVRARG